MHCCILPFWFSKDDLYSEIDVSKCRFDLTYEAELNMKVFVKEVHFNSDIQIFQLCWVLRFDVCSLSSYMYQIEGEE